MFKNNTIKKEWHRNYYREEMEKYVQLLGGICRSCGGANRLQFDHIDRKKKNFSIGKFLSHSKEEIAKELKKCQLLCCDCHEDKSIEERGFNSREEHGTLAAYRHGKCRCDKCRKVWSEYCKDYRKRKMESRIGVLIGFENRDGGQTP